LFFCLCPVYTAVATPTVTVFEFGFMRCVQPSNQTQVGFLLPWQKEASFLENKSIKTTWGVSVANANILTTD